MDVIGWLLITSVLLAALCLYFAPAIAAYMLKRRNLGAIAALNLLLGWTLIGWVGALVWACMEDR